MGGTTIFKVLHMFKTHYYFPASLLSSHPPSIIYCLSSAFPPLFLLPLPKKTMAHLYGAGCQPDQAQLHSRESSTTCKGHLIFNCVPLPTLFSLFHLLFSFSPPYSQISVISSLLPTNQLTLLL